MSAVHLVLTRYALGSLSGNDVERIRPQSKGNSWLDIRDGERNLGGGIYRRAQSPTRFTCSGDGEPIAPGHHGWLHWFNHPIPQGGHPNVDLWPDVSSYDPSELYPAPGLTTRTGEQVYLFSSRNARTVDRHFRWMAEHGVDGAYLQRFLGHCDPTSQGLRGLRDEVGDRVREAAEKEGRVWAIMYDVTDVPAHRVQHLLVQDWLHLLRNKRVLESPNYLKENGRPVVALWGLGFENRGHTPAMLRAISQFFRQTTPGGVYLMAGAPSHWRTAEGDADRDPGFTNCWLSEFDAISPWTIGRYKSEEEADSFAETKLKPDFEYIKNYNTQNGRQVDYIPVIFPGGSGYNMTEGKWAWNDMPRKGGRFLWKQIFNAHKIGVRTMYGAMWDEYDEGTAFMPVVTHKHKLPVSDKFNFMALDHEGHDLPADWYMRICGFAAEVLRGERRLFETFPSKELQDYWATRPKYEDGGGPSAVVGSGSASASGSGAPVPSSGPEGSSSGPSNGGGQSYEEWLQTQKSEQEDAPPPPYTLEEDEPAPTPAAPAAQTAPIAQSIPPAHAPVPGPTPAGPPASSYIAPTAPVHAHPEGPPQAPAPPVSQQTYPAVQGYGAYPPNAQSPPTAIAPADPMTNLSHDFGRIGITNPTQGPPVAPAVHPGYHSTSPPPVHPAHPAGQYGRPPSRPPTSSGTLPPQPNLYSRPQSSHSHSSSGSIPGHHTPSPQAQWPPGDWQSGNTTASGGAKLTRPQTFSASSKPASMASLQHSSTMRPNAGRPPVGGATTPPTGPPAMGTLPPRPPTTGPSPHQPPAHLPPSHHPPVHAPYPGYGTPTNAGTPSGQPPYGPPSHAPNMPPGPPAPYGHPGAPQFPGDPSRTSTIDGYGSYPNYSTYQTSGPSYPSHGYAQNPVPQPSWPGGPSPHTSPPISPGNQAFPSAHTAYGPDYGYNSHTMPDGSAYAYPSGGDSAQYAYNMPHANHQYQPSPGPNGPSYPNPSGAPASSYQPPGSSFPAPTHPSAASTPIGNQAMPWGPGGPSSGPPPALPQRPSNYSYGSSSSSTKPTGFNAAGSSAFGYALNAVDKVAGKKTRTQLEDLAQSGSKLFSKFTK